MLANLSETLRFLMRSEGEASDPKLLQDVEVSFERPSEGFAPTPATIDLFLYELREETELRTNEPEFVYNTTDGRVQIRRPPLRMDCSYLLTAWPAAGQPNAALEELRLLGEAVQVLARHETIPSEYLQGSIKSMEPPPRVQIAMGSTERGRGLAELWTALGNKLKPSLLVRVTIAVDTNPVPAKAEPLVTSVGIGVDVREHAGLNPVFTPQVNESFFHIGGRLTMKGVAATGAVVSLVKLNQTVRTDANGIFRFSSVPRGQYDVVAATQGPDGKIIQKQFELKAPADPGELLFLDFTN